MDRRTISILAILGVGALVLFAALGAYVLRPSAAPSGELTAIPVLPSPEVQQSDSESSQPAAASGALVFEVSADESQARFLINEVLNGADKTVVGTTNAVAAQILIDPASPADVQLGAVQVNARTFITDSGSRNRAIQNLILQTNTYELVTFTPTAYAGMPASIAVGDTFSFQVTGDLAIRDITSQVTFDVSVTVESDSRISGLASTTIDRATYDLQIPSVPQVASVEQTIILELEFVALAQ
ncbi:MAG TPA: YceI family protein [Anaerolineales bacterium]|nr:YceI family protein [Anaerolineales bacterium]HRQ91549.1 YceI family protein [Anaerolineales bacterium]